MDQQRAHNDKQEEWLTIALAASRASALSGHSAGGPVLGTCLAIVHIAGTCSKGGDPMLALRMTVLGS